MKHTMNYTLQNITRQAKQQKILYLPHLFGKFKGWRKRVVDTFVARFRFGLQTIISQEELARTAGVSRKAINEFISILNDIGFLESVMRYDGKYNGKYRFQYNRYILNSAFMTPEGREVWFLLFGCMDNWPLEKDFSLCLVTSNYNNLCPQEADSLETELNYPSTNKFDKKVRGRSPRTASFGQRQEIWSYSWWEYIANFGGEPNKPMDKTEAQLIFGSS